MDTNSSIDCSELTDPLEPETLRCKFGIVQDGDNCIGDGQFTFSNGDTYSGIFNALNSGIITREGNGVYTSVDGQRYDGFWASDILDCPDALIQFPDGSSFCGSVRSMKYNGNGHYTFPDDTFIDGTFLDNFLVKGEDSSLYLGFVDKCGIKWFGEVGERNITMLPIHHFIPKNWKVTGKHIPYVITESDEAGVALKTVLPKFSFPILSRKKLSENSGQETLMDDDIQLLQDEEITSEPGN